MTATRVSEKEYLASERVAEVRSEYVHGVVTMMPGGTKWHERVKQKVNFTLLKHCDTDGCEAFSSDFKVRVPNAGYLYPDASYACGPLFEGVDTLLNPIVVFEVLSPSTQARDRGIKLDLYRTIPSLRTYVILASRDVVALVYDRTAIGWILTDYRGRDAVVPLPAISLDLPLRDLYAKIPDDELSPETADSDGVE